MFKPAFLPYQSLYYNYYESEHKNDMQVLQYHDCYEIYLMTKGERYLFFQGTCYILKPGDLYILKPFEMHYTQSMNSGFYGRHLVNFSDNHLEKLLTPTESHLITNRLKSCIMHLDDKQFQKALFYFQGIAENNHSNALLAEKLQCSYLLELLDYLPRCMSEAEQLPDNTSIPDTKSEILEAIQYISLHYMDNLSLDYIADHVHLSKYYFCRQFAKTTGATFLEYLNNVRLSKAHQLLLSSDLSIAEIADETGFSSGVQLSRTFQTVYKMSPSKFRKAKR